MCRNLPASDVVALSGADWAAALSDIIIPLVGHLAMAVNAQVSAFHLPTAASCPACPKVTRPRIAAAVHHE